MTGLVCDSLGVERRRDGMARRVLDDINVTFRRGEVALVTGATGAGKTTLLHVLAGLLRPTAGQVLADGAPVSRWTAAHRDRFRASVGVIFQQPRFFDDLTVLENVIVPLVPRCGSIGALRERGMAVLESLAIADLAGYELATLSGGQRQRAAVARALVGKPRFVLADEPTAHQDDAHAAQVVQYICEACTHDAVVVIAAHDPRVAASCAATETYILSDGRIGTHS